MSVFSKSSALSRLAFSLVEGEISLQHVHLGFLSQTGWQLGEHGEWCKHTNFDLATRVPMMIYVPGMTSKTSPNRKTFPFQYAFSEALRFRAVRKSRVDSTNAFVEAVDLFPTVSELAGLPVPPLCPAHSPYNVSLCTEGISLVPLLRRFARSHGTHRNAVVWKSAVFSQYPRPTWKPGHDSMDPSLANIRFMGYTIRTDDYRYTEWLSYSPANFTANWSDVKARELYCYADDPNEDVNVAGDPRLQSLVNSAAKLLRKGWRGALPSWT